MEHSCRLLAKTFEVPLAMIVILAGGTIFAFVYQDAHARGETPSKTLIRQI